MASSTLAVLWKVIIFLQTLVFVNPATANRLPMYTFSPDSEIRLEETETFTILATGETNLDNFTEILFKTADMEIAKISGNMSDSVTYVDCPVRETPESAVFNCFNFTFDIRGEFLGRTTVEFFYKSVNGEPQKLPIVYDVVVLRKTDAFSEVFMYAIIAIVALGTIGFGCTIDLNKIKELLKKPIPPLIGLGCQFIINPMLTYAFGKAYGLSPALALGLFATGCCPGGGGSNMWSYLLDGDLNLSVLMTFCSTIVSFGMLPLWLYTLGATLIPQSVVIPFENIFYSLLALVVPCIIGVLIGRHAPKAAARIRKFMKPVLAVLLLTLFTVGIYTNLYMFVIMNNWRVLVSGFSVPYAAYVTSASVAWALRQPRQRIITIAIETAIQNTGIAVVLILTTFPKPEGDIAAVMPIATVVFTPFPLICLLIAKSIRKKFCIKDGESEKRTLEEKGTVEMEITPDSKEKSKDNKGLDISYDSIEKEKETNLSLTSVV